MRALIHFHAGGDYQPQAFLPRSACQPSPSPPLSLSHPLSSALILSLSRVRSVLSPFDRCASVFLFSAFAALLNRCSIAACQAVIVTTWSGCGIKDSVVIVDDYDNDDHVIAAVLKLRLYVYMYAHAETRASRMYTWSHVGRGDRRGEGDCSEAVDVYLYRDCSHALR